MQGEAAYRRLPEDINKWYVRNGQGEMVPFSAFASTHWSYGSPRLERYNGAAAVEIVGEAAQRISTGQAMEIMEQLVSDLPSGFGLEWTGMSYQERLSGARTGAVHPLAAGGIPLPGGAV